MPRLMCFATHHKTGTVWIRRTVQAMSAAFGVEWHGLWRNEAMWKVPQEGRAFLVNWAGWFPEALWQHEDVGFVHMIRDPRDVLLSGCVYHHYAAEQGERWLHQPRADFGGKTYQQALNAVQGDEAKLLFEMRGKHRETVEEMLRWPWGDARVFELRYEDLIRDEDCSLFARALAHLGFQGEALAQGRKLFWEQSLFGGMADIENRPRHLLGHVHSEGALQRWRREMPRAVGEAYAAEFGPALRALGYEQDDSWVQDLPESAAEAMRSETRMEG